LAGAQSGSRTTSTERSPGSIPPAVSSPRRSPSATGPARLLRRLTASGSTMSSTARSR
jgi:hypothetical protein